jgi:lantibiotic biosynthesis protein
LSAGRQRFLEAAIRIGRRLCRAAVWHDGRCNWLGWTMEPHGGQWVSAYRAMGATVYDGSAGIGLFLARLAPLAEDPIITTTSVGALAQALSTVDEKVGGGDYGFYAGLSGIAQSCVEGGTALQRDDVVERGRAAWLACADLPPLPQRLDVINGSAGLIPALVEAARRFKRDDLLEAAVRHGEHLVRVASRTEKGLSWDTLGAPNEPHLLGFAHGVSGIAHALGILSAATGRRDFLDAAREGLRYERAYFRTSEGNWPDLRSFVRPGPTGEPPCMLAWCHGAPGMGFARLALSQLFPDDVSILAEAETAIRTTTATLGQAAPGSGNFSLCHSDGGNADLLVLAGDILSRPDLRREAENVGFRAIDRFEDTRSPWPCGVPGAGESPNLLLGMAGIGYFLLRLYDSENVRSALLPAAIAEKPAKARNAETKVRRSPI